MESTSTVKLHVVPVSMLQRYGSRLLNMGSMAGDSKETRLEKQLLLISSATMAILSLFWGWVYFQFNQPIAASIPWTYAFISFCSIGHFMRTKKYRIFRFSQLLFSLFLPLLLMISLGGFVSSSAVILWSITSPAGALVFADRRQAMRWYFAFLSVVVIGATISYHVPVPSTLPPKVIASFFVLNIAGTSLVVYLLLHRFLNERAKAYRALKEAHLHQIEMQDQLIQQEKMASLGRLTAGVAHEIKNPLNFVNNFSGLSVELVEEIFEVLSVNKNKPCVDVVASVEDLFADLKDNVKRINKHGRRADAIIKSMLEHSRSGFTRRRAVEINEFIDEYLKLAYHGVRAQVDGFKAEVVREYDEHAKAVQIVPQEIGRVLLNIFGNAFDAIQEHSDVSEEAYRPVVKVETIQRDGEIEIRISDNGAGVAEEARSQIFEPFFTTKPPGKGTGLGLSLSYDIIVEGHGGNLSLSNNDAGETVFIISLPLQTESVGWAA